MTMIGIMMMMIMIMIMILVTVIMIVMMSKCDKDDKDEDSANDTMTQDTLFLVHHTHPISPTSVASSSLSRSNVSIYKSTHFYNII